MKKYFEIEVHERLGKTPDRIICNNCGWVIDRQTELCIASMFQRAMTHIYYTDHQLQYLILEENIK